MWNNAACVAKRFAALPKVNEEKKKEMLQQANTIYKSLYVASMKPCSSHHAIHHAHIACNWARVLDLCKSAETEKRLEEAVKTVEGISFTRSTEDLEAFGDQKPSEEDPPLEFLILSNNLAFLKSKRGTVEDLVTAKTLYAKTLVTIQKKLDLHSMQQDYRVQHEAFSAAMTLAEILLKLMDQASSEILLKLMDQASSDDARKELQKDAAQNFKFAAEGFEKLLGPLNVRSVACRHSYGSVRLQQGKEAVATLEAVAGSWEKVNMGGAAAPMLQQSLGLDRKEDVPPKLLQKLMRARALFSAASAFKAIGMATDPSVDTPPAPAEICQKFEEVLKMNKEMGKDDSSEVFRRLKGILAMAHAELGQLHGKEYQETRTLQQFRTTQEHFDEALKWLPDSPADKEGHLLRCRTRFNNACLQLTALRYADLSTWEKVSENFSLAADGYGELTRSGKCHCQKDPRECFYYQRAMCKFNLIKAVGKQRDWQTVKAQQKVFEVLCEELKQRKDCAPPDPKWEQELKRNDRRTSIMKEGTKPSKVSDSPESP
ncbi:unnamed protein product [Symbiodinium sp. CCMP2592]|nr:unnamed protein product [Symbiodinium sp. CCMP2592]